MRALIVIPILGLAGACSAPTPDKPPLDPASSASDATYHYTVNPDVAQLFAEGQVPFGAVFYLGGTPSAIRPGSTTEPAYVGFELDGVSAQTDIARGDTLIMVATKLKRAFESKRVTCSIHNGGAMIVCVSPDGTHVEEYGSETQDQDLSVGSDLLKF